MAQQFSANTLALILIDDGKREFGLCGTQYDVTCATHDSGSSVFLHHRDDRHVIDKIDVGKRVNLLFGEVSPHTKEAAVERLRASAINSCEKSSAVVRSQSTDFDRASIRQVFNRIIVGRERHS